MLVSGGAAVQARLEQHGLSGDEQARTPETASALSTELAGVPGLEPRLTGPEPVGLPITPYPNGIAPGGRVRSRSLADSGRAGQYDIGQYDNAHKGSMTVRPASRSRRSQRVIPAERRNGTSWLAATIAPR